MTAKITRIREANSADRSLLSRLIRNSYRDVADRFRLTPANCPKHPSNCTDEWIANDFTRGVRYFLLERENLVAGCVAIEKANSNLCYLERLAVLPHHRKKGFGRQLVQHVIRIARNSEAQQISIGVIAQQTELRRWYQKFGFAEGPTKKFSHLPFEVTFMTYDLSPFGFDVSAKNIV